LFEDDGYRKLCFQCFNLKKYREATKLQDSTNSLGQRDSERAESNQPNLLPTSAEAKTTGFENEARLLELMWRRVHEFKPKPSEEQAASLTATLFIDVTKAARFDKIRR
jgi:hypothetical protein